MSGITTLVAEQWFADPEAWRYLAAHAAQVRQRVPVRSAEWVLLGRTVGVAQDMASALTAAYARHAGEQDTSPGEGASVLARGTRRVEYLMDVLIALDAGTDPLEVCASVGRAPTTVARALRTWGYPGQARLIDRARSRHQRAAS